MKKIRETKSVYFSLLEPYDVELLIHAKQINPITGKERNFSRYVRKLIEEDMRRIKEGYTRHLHTTDTRTYVENEGYTEEIKNALESFL